MLTMHTAENTRKSEESGHNRTEITGIEERIHTYILQLSQLSHYVISVMLKLVSFILFCRQVIL